MSLAARGAACYLHPALGEALAAADVIVPLVLLAAILRGGTETCERVFRLLRWAASRPEPPGPGGIRPGRAPRAAAKCVYPGGIALPGFPGHSRACLQGTGQQDVASAEQAEPGATVRRRHPPGKII